MVRVRVKAGWAGLAAAVAVAVGLTAGSAQGCGFHGYLPDETVIDRMLASDHIVLARADPANPFRFEAVAAIRGPLADVDIPQLVDSQTRRKLAQNPADTVLFARDEAYGPWQRLAYLDAAYGAVIDEVAGRLDDWSWGDDPERFQYFADLLHHPNPGVAALVLAELDRAPYEIFDGLRMAPDADELMRDFHAPSRIRTIPIRVLLLGRSGDDRARDFLRARFDGGVPPWGAIAGAYATALIEIDGRDGAARVAAVLGERSDLDAATREVLVEALAIHAATGEPELRKAVRAIVAGLLEAQPALAGPAARQFGARGDGSLQWALAGLQGAGRLTSDADRYEVTRYLAAADPLAAN